MKNLTAEDMVIALLVALFLRKSDRIQKAIEMWNECLVLLNNTDKNSKDQFNSLRHQIYKAIYLVLFRAYCRISDYKSAERYGRKLLVLYSESGDLAIEGDVSMALAEIVESQNRFTDAKQLYEKAMALIGVEHATQTIQRYSCEHQSEAIGSTSIRFV